MDSLGNGQVEWNFSNTIKRDKSQESPTPSTSDDADSSDGEKEVRGSNDTRRHTLTEDDDEIDPLRLEIDDTAFVIGDRSSLVIGEGESDSSASSEGVGDGGREGGEGGKVCVLQEPERTQGDGQETEKRLSSPPSSSLHNVILPLVSRVSHVTSTFAHVRSMTGRLNHVKIMLLVM